jgi:hypothetical protein
MIEVRNHKDRGRRFIMEYKVPLRIVVVDPPEDVYFCLADDEGNLVSVTRSTGADITFDFEAIVKANRRTGAPNFTGPFASGTPSKRFFYVNIGKSAGQEDSPWERRAKIWISDISWETVKEVASHPNKVLIARYMGKDKEGGPKCASIDLLDGTWVIGHR